MIDTLTLKRNTDIAAFIGKTEPLKPPPGGRGEWVGVNHDSLKVNQEKMAYFWHSRGLYGDVFNWCIDVLGETWGEAVRNVTEWVYGYGATIQTKTPVYVPPAPKPALEPISFRLVDRLHEMLLRTPAALDWCYRRSLTLEDIKRFRLGFIESHADVGPVTVIPIINNGEVATIRYRAWKPKDDMGKYMPLFCGRNAHLINADALVDKGDSVLVVEGEFKVFHLMKRGFPVVGIMGASTMKAEWLPRFATKKTVYVALDPDQTPETLGWVSRLAGLHSDVKIVALPMKPDDLVLVEGGVEALRDCLNQARRFVVKS